MAALVIAGRLGNILTGASFTSSVAADALFPFSKLADGVPASRGKFGSQSADPWVTADVDLLRGLGGFEQFSGGGPVGFVEANSGTGDVTQESTIVHGGLFSARFAAGAGPGVAACYRDVVVRAGQRLFIDIWLRGDSGGLGQIALRCRNLNSRRYMTSGVWSPSDVETFVHTGATWVNFTQAFTVESAAACGTLLPTLRFHLSNIGVGGVGYADDFILLPGVTSHSVHGHNIDAGAQPELRASTDNFASSNVLIASPTPRQPSFYSTFSVAYYRYWRQQFFETNVGGGPIWEGEWVLGDPLRLESGPLYPMRSSYRDAQLRVPMRWGFAPIGVGPAYPLRTVPMSLRGHSVAERDVILSEVFHRSHGGVPAVVVPHDSDGHTEVIYGLIAEDLPHEWWLADGVDLSTAIAELPLPYVTG